MAQLTLIYDRFHPQIGGLERMIREVGECLAQHHRVSVAASALPDSQLETTLGDLTILRRPLWSRRWKSVLGRSDAVLGFGYMPHSRRALFTLILAWRARRRGTPVFWFPTYHPPSAESGRRPRHGWKTVLPSRLRTLAQNLVASQYRVVFRQAHCIFALTDREREHWLSEIPGVRARVVPHGVSSSHGTCIQKSAAQAWMALRFGTGPHVLCVGRFAHYKNQEVVIRALGLLRERMPTAQLILVGPDGEGTGPTLRRLTTALPFGTAVRFTGSVSQEDLCRLYAGSDCLVHPSRHEASGITPLEALAHGTPAIHSGRGGLARYGTLAGCWTVTSLEDPMAWALAIERVLHSSVSDRLAVAEGQRVVLDRYTWEDAARTIGDELGLVLSADTDAPAVVQEGSPPSEDCALVGIRQVRG